MENRGTVRSVAKAMELLQLLSERGESLSLTEIARMQELPKSTAFGLLNTLREYEMVSQGRDGRYSLGIRLFEYGCRVSRAWDVPRLARPYLEQLAAQVNVSAVLSIREGDRVMTLDQVEGHGSLRVVSEVGGRLPLHCTSQGKVFLAALAQSEAQALLGRRPLTAYTPHTVTDAAQLLASLEQVRRQGYAVEDGEYKIGLRSVSAPVYGVDGAVRCTVGIRRHAAQHALRGVPPRGRAGSPRPGGCSLPRWDIRGVGWSEVRLAVESACPAAGGVFGILFAADCKKYAAEGTPEIRKPAAPTKNPRGDPDGSPPRGCRCGFLSREHRPCSHGAPSCRRCCTHRTRGRSCCP